MEGPRPGEEEPLLGPGITVAAGDCTCHEEEEFVKGGNMVNWRPRKGCLTRNVSDSETHQSRFSGCPCYESDSTHSDSSGPPTKWLGDFDDFQSDLENWELDDEACFASFPELKIDSQYEKEDWDKELEDAECNPYDADDIDCCSLQEHNLLASCAWQEESLYNPGCHHAAPLTLSLPNRMREVGQFDDADD